MCSGCSSLLAGAHQEATVVTNSLKGFFFSSSIPGMKHMFWSAHSITQDRANKTRPDTTLLPLRSSLGKQLSLQPPSSAFKVKMCGEGNGNPLHYSCLENLMGRGAWKATVQGVLKNQTHLSHFHFHFTE